MQASELIKVTVDRPFDEVYDFLCDPMNFPRWAANPDSGIEAIDSRDFIIEVPRGRVTIRFAPRNSFGILDYQVFAIGGDGGPVTPVRAYANGAGTDVVVTWFQRGTTDERFASDVEWVRSDLERMKTLVESR